MAGEENHNACKRSRVGVGNGGSGPAAAKLGQRGQLLGDGGEDGEGKAADGGRGGLRPWHHPSSRIFRVSRASGGKDRHSKVYTAKGLRDRRVRLSVSTAIQFYDLQDRLGYDQPSKAIEWLIKKAASSIAELPTLESSFPEPLKLHPGEEKPELDTEMVPVNDNHQQQQHQHLSLTKSGCSSTSETSKGSVLSLSRSENRVKARERARERAAKEKDRDECDGHVVAQHQNVNPSLNPQSSFTELLTGSGSNGAAVTAAQVNSSADCIQKQIRYLPVTSTADYLAHAGFFAQETHQPPSGFAHLGNGSPMGMMPFNMAAAAAAAAAGEHSEMHQFSFFQDHPIPIAAVATGDYNLNFSISPGLAGFNRGTLQSNSPSQLPHHHLQRLSSPADRSNLPFFFGAAPSASAAASAENPFPAGFDGRLQLCYSEGFSHSDVKGKGKS